MVSTSYPSDLTDWRGLFIRHLVEALSKRENLLVRLWAPPGELPPRSNSAATRDESRWLAKLMSAGGIAHLIRTNRIRGICAVWKLLFSLRRLYRRETSADLLHVNWLQNTLMLPNDGRPLLTTVLGTDMQLLKLPGMIRLLRRIFSSRRTAICPNAEWMVPILERHFGDLARIRFVPFGIEPRWFAVKRQPTSPQQWLCVSRLTEGKIGRLFSWGEKYFNDGKRELHLFGPMQQKMILPEWVHYHGPATPESLCSNSFPSAQGLITLSQHAEGRPQVMLEAMAAGLPVIASSIPGHEDMLTQNETGWLCAAQSDLGQALEALGDNEFNILLGLRARHWTMTEIGTWDECATRYENIYRELLMPEPVRQS